MAPTVPRCPPAAGSACLIAPRRQPRASCAGGRSRIGCQCDGQFWVIFTSSCAKMASEKSAVWGHRLVAVKGEPGLLVITWQWPTLVEVASVAASLVGGNKITADVEVAALFNCWIRTSPPAFNV